LDPGRRDIFSRIGFEVEPVTDSLQTLTLVAADCVRPVLLIQEKNDVNRAGLEDDD
jgi:hypothetical protein